MSLVTPELIEKAWGAGMSELSYADFDMKAALTAILPDIIEAAAKVADREARACRIAADDPTMAAYSEENRCAQHELEWLAEAIRALAQERPAP